MDCIALGNSHLMCHEGMTLSESVISISTEYVPLIADTKKRVCDAPIFTLPRQWKNFSLWIEGRRTSEKMKPFTTVGILLFSLQQGRERGERQTGHRHGRGYVSKVSGRSRCRKDHSHAPPQLVKRRSPSSVYPSIPHSSVLSLMTTSSGLLRGNGDGGVG